MSHDFDRRIERRQSDCEKWNCYEEDVLPLWVADMDFKSPEPVIRALHERVEHGVLGYGSDRQPELRRVIVERLERLYGWAVTPEALVFIPGVIRGFNMACRVAGSTGEGVLIQPPVYPPFFRTAANAGMVLQENELIRHSDGSWGVDFDAFEAAISPQTRVFILCNPHNPVGRVFRRDELERMAEICLRHDVLICSDEIHCDLVFNGYRHIPIASLAPEIAARTITLMAPSKTYNIAGLDCAVAIVEDADVRARFCATRAGLVSGVNILGYVAALAAYSDGQPWLDDLLEYLEANRDFLLDYVAACLPGIRAGKPEATYLAWLDCREAGIPGKPHDFFLKQARVALNDGLTFGRGWEGFVRLNFGCPRSVLAEALERMHAALARL